MTAGASLPNFGELMGLVAHELFGEPNRRHSSQYELRFGSNGSLAVDLRKGVFFDHESGVGGGVLDLIERETKLRGAARVDWLSHRFPEAVAARTPRPSGDSHNEKLGTAIAAYDYVDEGGALLFQVVRYHPKTFRQRRRDNGGNWSWSVRDVRPVPYHLPELVEAIGTGGTVFVVEGEKDVDNLIAIGAHATCNAGGAGKWSAELNEYFRNGNVVVIGDADPQARNSKTGELRFHPDGKPVCPGQDHARDVCKHLSGVARQVQYLDLKLVWPACPEKGDISDWIAADEGTVERLNELIKSIPVAVAAPAHLNSGHSKTSRPTIQIAAGELVPIIEAIEEALLADGGPPIFQRGGMLVRLVRQPNQETKQGIQRPANALTICSVNKEWLRIRMAESAHFEKWDGRANDIRAADPPLAYAAALLSLAGQWKFPSLKATIEAPTLRPDGSVLQTPGYDEATGLYFDPGSACFPPIDDSPQRASAEHALETLKQVFVGFPFVDETARSVALAAVLTALARRCLPTAPLFVFDAPARGTGKTLITRVVAGIATGREAAVMTFTGNPDEERKRIVASLLAGDPVLSFDNIDKPLQGDALCMVLTSSQIQDRRLVVSEMISVPTCVTWLGNGNNVTVIGDLSTRVLPCRIDSGVERPEEREFTGDLMEFIQENRPQLVQAALTVLRAFVVAGRPRQNLKPFGRFEKWSDLIRAALVWLGCPDPCASRDQLTHDDPVTETLQATLVALHDTFKGSPFQAAEVARESMGGDVALQLALEAALPKGEVRPRAIGAYFRQHKDRIVGGLRLRKGGTYIGAVRWQVEIVGGTGP